MNERGCEQATSEDFAVEKITDFSDLFYSSMVSDGDTRWSELTHGGQGVRQKYGNLHEAFRQDVWRPIHMTRMNEIRFSSYELTPPIHHRELRVWWIE